MIVRRLELHNFKKFRDAAIDFAPGLNVVEGPNEAGKSTLHAALRMAFFEKPTATAQQVKRARSWQADEMFSIEVDIDVDGDGYRLRKDFASRKATLTGESLPEPVTDPDAVQGRLCSWLGCPSEKFFASTVCVGQDEVAGWDAGEMAGHLQAVIAGGDVTARGAIKALRAALQKLRVGVDRPAANPGPIKVTQDRLTALSGSRARVAEQVTRVADATKTIAEREEELERTRAELADKSRAVEKTTKARELESQIAALEKDYGVRQRARTVHVELGALAEEEASMAPAAAQEKRISQLSEQSTRLDENRRTLDRMRQETAEVATEVTRSPLLVIVGAIVLVAGIAAGYTITPGMYVAALAGLGILIFSLARYTAGRAKAPAGDSREAVLEEEVKAGETALRETLAELGVASVEEATARLETLRDVRERLGSKESELRGATGGKSWEEFDEQTGGLATQIEQKKEVLQQLSPSVLGPLAFERLQGDVNRLSSAQERCEKQIAEAGYIVAHSDVDADELAHIDDEISELSETKQQLAHLQEVYEAAIAGIEQAERETMREATRVLQVSVNARVARMTGARYREVKVDEEDLSMTARSEEKGDWAVVGTAAKKWDDSELSRATRDQLYLAARLGLAEYLCGDAAPPLLLDDPFVTFDEERLERSMELLKEIAAERQVLLFTCHKGYERYADHVVDLGAHCKETVS